MTIRGRFSSGRLATGRFSAGRFSGQISNVPAVPLAPSQLGLPAISPAGESPQGATLSCSPGIWSGYPVPSFAYQWTRDGADLPGAEDSSYTTVPADIGRVLTCVVTVANSEGSASAEAEPVSVGDAYQEPENTVAPTVSPSGLQPEGTELTATDGTWTGNPVPTLSFQWRRSGVDILGETQSSYTISAMDVATEVDCAVSGSNVVGATTALSNAVTVPARSAPLNAELPVISGSTAIPATLSVTSGSWTGNPAPGITYQWMHNGTDIPGATSASYETVATDDGATLSCRVTATNSEGSVSVASNGLSVSLGAAEPSWPESVLAAHIGRDTDISATQWDDISGNDNHMTLLGAPSTTLDGTAVVLSFDGATQSGRIADAAARWNGSGFDGAVNVAVTAKYIPTKSAGVVLGGARASDYAIAADTNSGLNLVRNNVSNDPNVIGTPTETGVLTSATDLIDGVQTAMDVAAAMDPAGFQTIIIRNLEPNTAWGGMTFLRDGDGSYLKAEVVAVTIWTGSLAADESAIIAIHGQAAAGVLA